MVGSNAIKAGSRYRANEPIHAFGMNGAPGRVEVEYTFVRCLNRELLIMANFHYRILVVDDDEQIRQVSELVLSQCGYEVRTASHGFEALALMRKAVPDLIVSDLNMPNMSGFELLSIVRRRFPQLPVIAITGEYSTSEPEGLLADAIFHKGPLLA